MVRSLDKKVLIFRQNHKNARESVEAKFYDNSLHYSSSVDTVSVPCFPQAITFLEPLASRESAYFQTKSYQCSERR